LTGTLNLDALGDPDALFIFQIGSTLTTASGSAVNVLGGENNRVVWRVGSSATLGSGSTFEGSILALKNVTMNTGAAIPCGRALALAGAVTLDANTISTCSAVADFSDPGTEPGPGGVGDVPEPGTVSLFCVGLLALTLYAWHSRKPAFKSR
jgi:type VI secretion system secreted protein VgrG